MKLLHLYSSLGIGLMLMGVSPRAGLCQTTAPPPTIFFSDLDSGPNAGGENNAGVYVTVYGKHFGASQSSSAVKIGNTPATVYKTWSDSKVAFQIPAAAPINAQGITIFVNGVASNVTPFTVRANGKIYCVSTSGSDSNVGTFQAGCWRTAQHAVDVMSAGDTTYVRQGVVETAPTGYGSVVVGLNVPAPNNGTEASPIALGGYPGETAQIGQAGSASCTSPNCTEGFGTYPIGYQYNHWTVFNLTLRGSNFAFSVGNTFRPNQGSGWRVIGNDMSCPWMYSESGGYCSTFSSTNYIYYYGNTIHDTGTLSSRVVQEYNGAVYFTTDSSHAWVGWNTVYNAVARGIQFHSSPDAGGGASDPTGYNQFDIHIHDNIVHDTGLDGIGITTSDPSQGPVELYNNILYKCGKGPAPPSGGGNYAGIILNNATNNGPTGSGIIEVFNNTLYQNSNQVLQPAQNGWAGAITSQSATWSSPIRVHLRNNIVVNVPGVPYFQIDPDQSATSPLIYGSNNLFYGNGALIPNPNVTSSVNEDPLFSNASGGDFHLQSNSPAIKAGTVTPVSSDLDALPRSQSTSYSIGAYEYPNGTALPATSIIVSPASTSLAANQVQQFTATVSGSSNTSVTWRISPNVGSISNSGVYTAPSAISSQQSIVVTATSTADTTKTASATVTLNPPVSPPPVSPSISITPTTVSLSGGQTHQFTATVSNSSSGVNWSITPAVGSLSAAGLYTAPASVSSQQTVTITTTLKSDTTKTASATVTLMPQQVTPSSLTYTVTPTQITLQWSSPIPATPYDSVALSSVDAPDWWTTWMKSTNGASHGTTALTTPKQSGRYEFRYLSVDSNGNNHVTARSAPLSIATQSFSITPEATTVSVNSTLNVSWTAGAGSNAADAICLFAVGAASDAPTPWYFYPGGANGTVAVTIPGTPGQYQLRYIHGPDGFLEVAASPVITAR